MMFHESNEGVMPRKKLRLRSYPGHSADILLETKVSSSEGRYKKSILVCEQSKSDLLSKGKYFDGYGMCDPTIEISYLREYFQLGDFRITMDRDITYSRYGHSFSYIDSESVMEVKFGHLASCEAIYSIMSLQESRFSKYERAIKATNS
jgi:hypothetical protein